VASVHHGSDATVGFADLHMTPALRCQAPIRGLVHISRRGAWAMLAGLCAILVLSSGCASTGAPKMRYTKELNRRADQRWWIKQDLVQLLGKCIAEDSRTVDIHAQQKVVQDLSDALRICFYQGSDRGEDVDGGIRAMNFFRNAYFRAGGDYWSWRDATRRCERIGDRGLAAPANAIPVGYR